MIVLGLTWMGACVVVVDVGVVVVDDDDDVMPDSRGVCARRHNPHADRALSPRARRGGRQGGCS
eukprot:3355754-Rhodomonas_salina.1